MGAALSERRGTTTSDIVIRTTGPVMNYARGALSGVDLVVGVASVIIKIVRPLGPPVVRWTPVPLPAEASASEIVDRVVQLARWGRGSA